LRERRLDPEARKSAEWRADLVGAEVGERSDDASSAELEARERESYLLGVVTS
jgi:hypothetical protein